MTARARYYKSARVSVGACIAMQPMNVDLLSFSSCSNLPHPSCGKSLSRHDALTPAGCCLSQAVTLQKAEDL